MTEDQFKTNFRSLPDKIRAFLLSAPIKKRSDAEMYSFIAATVLKTLFLQDLITKEVEDELYEAFSGLYHSIADEKEKENVK